MPNHQYVADDSYTSWGVKNWPPNVYPNSAKAGELLVQRHRCALVHAGALVREGRTLVIIGERFRQWLAAQAHRVEDFDVAPNRPTNWPRRFGRCPD
jgi:hypothetical protein